MTTDKFTIKNRHGLNVVIQVDAGSSDARKLAFVAHGQKGTMKQPHIEAFARAFLANDYRVVRFDATHSVGESDGDLENVTFDSYINDLEDVIAWSRSREWFVEPFALCGHSMGAQSTAWYAEHHPGSVSILAAMAPVVNFELHSSTYDSKVYEQWQKNGEMAITSSVYPDRMFHVKWELAESLKRFDLLPSADRLTMPVLNIVGSEDKSCPPNHQTIFMDSVASSKKDLIIVEGLEHSYRSAKTNQIDDGLTDVESIIKDWVKTNDA